MYMFCISDVHAYFISGNIHLHSTYWSKFLRSSGLENKTNHLGWKRSNHGELRHCWHSFCFINNFYQFLLQNNWLSLWVHSGSVTKFTVKWRTRVYDRAQTSQSVFLQNGWILDSSGLKRSVSTVISTRAVCLQKPYFPDAEGGQPLKSISIYVPIQQSSCLPFSTGFTSYSS